MVSVAKHIAVHEAGHLLAAWYCSSVVEIVEAVAEDTKGGVLYSFLVTGSAIDLWNQLVISLAGITAELMHVKVARATSSREDLRRSVELAEVLSEQCNAKRAFPIDTTDNDNITRMFFDNFSPDVRHLLEAAHLKTILVRTEPLFLRAVSAIMTGAKLNHKTIEGILGPRPTVKEDGGFVLPKAKEKPKDSWGTRALGFLLELFD